MPPPDSHRIFDPWEALRRDRDRWAQTAMEQAEYIRQLEQEVKYYKIQLEMKNEEQKCKPNITIENHGSLTFIAEQKNDIHDNNNCPIYLTPNAGKETETNTHETCVEDVTPVDTSFFCTQQFTEDIIEKNLRQAITLASSKADACRRVMALEPLGYVVLSNVTDERKAELVNPFAMPKYRLTGEDFKKARKSSHSFPGK